MTGATLTTIDEFEFEDGSRFGAVPVAYRSWGTLNADGTNCVVVCHALTGDTNVSEWWGELFGTGRAFDLERDFVICANVIGSPYGTFSPITRDSQTGEPFGTNFPVPTIRDTVNLHRRLLTQLGVHRVKLCIGGSMGGMQVLEWGFHSDLVEALVPIAVGGRHSAWCIAWSEAQRQAIYCDPNYNGGDYSDDARPELGLAIARMIAMTTYRSFDSFSSRFGRAVAENGDDAQFAMKGYLHYQGAKLVDRFDANCYVTLANSMDTHDVARGRGAYEEVLQRILQPTLVIGIDSDMLYPLAEQRELAEHLPRARLAVLNARHGHDSFLIERDALNDTIVAWRQSNLS